MKTLSLETSLVDVSFGDEESMDVLSSLSLGNISENSSPRVNNPEDSECLIESSEQGADDKFSILQNIQKEEEKTDTKEKLEKEERNDTVWGSHLSVVNKIVETKQKPAKTDISFRYTAKLFPGATFKKRNPRKAFIRREKSADISVSQLEDAKLSITTDLSQNCSEQETPLNVETETSFKEEPKTSSINLEVENSSQNYAGLKYKIVTNSDTSKPSQPVSVLQKTVMSNSSTKQLVNRTVDKGWVERLDKVLKIDVNRVNTSDSGIELTDSSVLEPRSSSLSESQLEINSDDEDLVCDSGSEDENTKSSTLNNSLRKSISFSTVKNISNCYIKRTSFSSTCLKEVDSKDNEDRQLIKAEKRQMDEDGSCITTDDRPNKKFKVDANSSSDKYDTDTYNRSSNSLPIEKSITLNNKGQNNVLPLKPLIKMQNKVLTEKEIKLKEILKNKVSSGKANENFIKINIKKKTYVRGKKTMTFQKYKKQKWKQLKKSQNGNEKGLLKCFKCGEVGHFASNCLKGNFLLQVTSYYSNGVPLGPIVVRQ